MWRSPLGRVQPHNVCRRRFSPIYPRLKFIQIAVSYNKLPFRFATSKLKCVVVCGGGGGGKCTRDAGLLADLATVPRSRTAMFVESMGWLASPRFAHLFFGCLDNSILGKGAAQPRQRKGADKMLDTKKGGDERETGPAPRAVTFMCRTAL